jgi:alpha-glucosidase
VDPVGKSSPGHSRDPERTPMQWDASPNAGFSSGEPWLPVADDHAEVNVAAQQKDPHSHLALFKRLTGLRRQTEALSTGSYRSLDAGDEAVFAYLRESGEERVLVALNFRPVPTEVNLSAAGNAGDLLCSTLMDWEGQVDPARLALRPDEGVVVRLPG